MRARQPRTPSDTSPAAATTAGLVLLGRRELTASQLRERLLRKGYPDTSVAEALDRLTTRGLVDDARAAGARARHGVVVHRRGRARVLREVQALGVPDETARRAVAAAFDEVDEDRMVAEALQRKLRGAPIPKDARDRQRLYGWLLRQGFDAHRIQRVLKGGAAAGWYE
jgi:regulatory protein